MGFAVAVISNFHYTQNIMLGKDEVIETLIPYRREKLTDLSTLDMTELDQVYIVVSGFSVESCSLLEILFVS